MGLWLGCKTNPVMSTLTACIPAYTRQLAIGVGIVIATTIRVTGEAARPRLQQKIASGFSWLTALAGSTESDRHPLSRKGI